MNWQKQTKDKPLFEDLLWSRPENKKQAGKLLIIGGQTREFKNISHVYSFTAEAGAGHIKMLMPEGLRKITQHIEGAEFAPSNKGGGFAKSALAQFFDLSEWADHILLAGDFGKNSETTVILDGFLLKNSRPLTISQNALESIGISYDQLTRMPLTLVIDRNMLQKIGKATGTHVPITSLTTYENMGGIIQDISSKSKANFVIVDEEHIWAAVNKELVSTRSKPVDVNVLSAYCAVWQMQNPAKPLEALATAIQQSIV